MKRAIFWCCIFVVLIGLWEGGRAQESSLSSEEEKALSDAREYIGKHGRPTSLPDQDFSMFQSTDEDDEDGYDWRLAVPNSDPVRAAANFGVPKLLHMSGRHMQLNRVVAARRRVQAGFLYQVRVEMIAYDTDVIGLEDFLIEVRERFDRSLEWIGYKKLPDRDPADQPPIPPHLRRPQKRKNQEL